MTKNNPSILKENIEFLIQTKQLEGSPSDYSKVDSLYKVSEKLELELTTLLTVNLAAKGKLDLSKIKFFIMDCDGVLTDGGMSFTESGDEIKRFNVKDGQGIKNIQGLGILTGVISAGVNQKIVKHRGEMLGIEHVYIGKQPKIEILDGWLKELNLTMENVAYIGDDLKDLPILTKAGFSCCPADAVLEVRQAVDLVLSKNGGAGCVRELADNYFG